MRFLVILEQTEAGFAVQVPDLAIITSGADIEAAKNAAREAIQINLQAYRDAGQPVPPARPITGHLDDPEFRDLLFTYVEVPGPENRLAA